MITVTENAKNYLLNLLLRKNFLYVKLSVKGGGCAGFSYDYSYTNEQEPGGIVVNFGTTGRGLVIDSMSLLYVAGTELDYVEDIAGSSLQIRNPNETSSCGCGKSFAV